MMSKINPQAEVRRQTVMRLLETKGPLTQKEIARKTGLTIAQANSAIGVLNNRRAVERREKGRWGAAGLRAGGEVRKAQKSRKRRPGSVKTYTVDPLSLKPGYTWEDRVKWLDRSEIA
jgi:predicted ArsR family transcriptional regulator